MNNYYIVRSDDHLEHHGVKGMRWGHRKSRPTSVSRASRKRASEAWKLKRRKAKANTSALEKVALFATSGPTGLYQYHSMQARGYDKGTAAASSIIAGYLTGGAGNIAISTIMGHKARKEERGKSK